MDQWVVDWKHVGGYLTETDEVAAKEELYEEFVGVDAGADSRAAVHAAHDESTHEFDTSSQWNEDRSPALAICYKHLARPIYLERYALEKVYKILLHRICTSGFSYLS